MQRAALAITLLVASGAHAYVRTTSERSGRPVEWPVRCLIVRPDLRGSQDVTMADIVAVLERSVANWTSRTNACSPLALQAAPPTRVADVGIDGQPTVVFRDREWSRPGSRFPHDPAAIGITTVFYVDTPGFVGDATILDADVELNGVYYTFTTEPATAQPRNDTQLADLENTLTHELGHVQGLAHTCWDHVDPEPPVDNHGVAIVDCNGAVPEAIKQTTMYPYATMPGETSKRDLSDDDLSGVCEVYPISGTPTSCHNEIHGGCSVAGASSSWLALLLAIALARLRR